MLGIREILSKSDVMPLGESTNESSSQTVQKKNPWVPSGFYRQFLHNQFVYSIEPYGSMIYTGTEISNSIWVVTLSSLALFIMNHIFRIFEEVGF